MVGMTLSEAINIAIQCIVKEGGVEENNDRLLALGRAIGVLHKVQRDSLLERADVNDLSS